MKKRKVAMTVGARVAQVGIAYLVGRAAILGNVHEARRQGIDPKQVYEGIAELRVQREQAVAERRARAVASIGEALKENARPGTTLGDLLKKSTPGEL